MTGEAGDHGGERADLVAGGLQFRTAGEDGLEPGLLVLGQGFRAAGQPARDLADGGRGLGQRGLCGAVLVEVVADDGVAAVVAEGLDLVEQAGVAAVAAAGVPVEVGLEGVELAGPLGRPAALGELLPSGGAVVALDGVQSLAQVAGDLPQAAAFGPQAVNQLVLGAGPLGAYRSGQPRIDARYDPKP